MVAFERNPQHLPVSGEDEVYLYAWCPSEGTGMLSGSAPRRAEQVSLQLPDRWRDAKVWIYGFVQDYAGLCGTGVGQRVHGLCGVAKSGHAAQ